MCWFGPVQVIRRNRNPNMHQCRFYQINPPRHRWPRDKGKINVITSCHNVIMKGAEDCLERHLGA